MVKLNIIGDPEETLVEQNELDRDSMGGTELMKYGLYDRLPKQLLERFQIIPSRVRELSKTKKKICVQRMEQNILKSKLV